MRLHHGTASMLALRYRQHALRAPNAQLMLDARIGRARARQQRFLPRRAATLRVIKPRHEANAQLH